MSIASLLGFRQRPDARQDARNRILLRASLLASGRPTPVYLLDLSRKGALAHADQPPEPGETVWLVCRGNEVLSRTAWVRGNRFGLAFDQGLPAAKFEMLLAEGRRGLVSANPSSPRAATA
ncbi:PilZ domain-containing protein [Rhizorhabdus dicambivorans]|uniref:PilZ domain-containing protein n=1 Tax=Rhizorhabdus dicambivorans TaxID=1850238 RepID=A0A2A4FVG2_9SPHN|nr:PilZ domain-containing protein [Rhizorhabdus dicambivorans]ATE64570.1 PilZ domain-containing protein [Rhizorhabdus dicambivorans]PCE41666.1 PilZ domain-containing protein [Rhizorhabdus dicambivorans]